jgi:hypothetical protein
MVAQEALTDVEWITVREAAARLGISPDVFRGMAKTIRPCR